MGLPQQRERVTVDGLGKIGANSRFVSGKTVAKSDESGIMKVQDIVIGRSVGAKAKNYVILDPDTGELFNFVEGTKIQNAQVFAGKAVKSR